MANLEPPAHPHIVLLLGLSALVAHFASCASTADTPTSAPDSNGRGGSSGAQSGSGSRGAASSGGSIAEGNDATTQGNAVQGEVGPSSSSGSSSDGGAESGDEEDAEQDATPDDGGSSSDGSASGGNCGTRTGMRGQTFRTLMVDGTARTYYAYLPSSVGATTPAALVFAMHGAAMNAADMASLTGYESVADTNGVAVAFLDGQGANSEAGTTSLTPWNFEDPGATTCGVAGLVNNSMAVDFDFMDAVKADIAQDQCLDANHLFATGFSVGGYFAHHIACERPDIRAVGPASGATLASLSSCTTGHVPIIIFHGTSDGVVPDGCDDPTSNGTPQAGFPASATLWAQKNGCGTTYQTIPNNMDASSSTGQCYLWNGCPTDGQVELCTFNGMNHDWAGGSDASPFGAPDYASATQLEWSFFKQYAW